MTQTQVTRANEIIERVRHLERQYQIWETAGYFTEVAVRPKITGVKSWCDKEILDFELIRTVTISRIKMELEKLQNEFAAL